MSSRCAACKHLRKRCQRDCIFSPYFPSNDPQRFDSMRRIYGASNIAKMLQQLPQHLRAEAANSMYFEAQCRPADPVYGCVKTISLLRQQIDHAHGQLAIIQAEIALYKAQIHGDNNQIQNADHQLPVSRFYNYLAADQGNGFPHPTPPTPSIQPPRSM